MISEEIVLLTFRSDQYPENTLLGLFTSPLVNAMVILVQTPYFLSLDMCGDVYETEQH